MFLAEVIGPEVAHDSNQAMSVFHITLALGFSERRCLHTEVVKQNVSLGLAETIFSSDRESMPAI